MNHDTYVDIRLHSKLSESQLILCVSHILQADTFFLTLSLPGSNYLTFQGFHLGGLLVLCVCIVSCHLFDGDVYNNVDIIYSEVQALRFPGHQISWMSE